MSADYKIKSLLKSTKILVVEDDSIMTSLMRDVLDVMGFGEILTSKDGKSALALFALHDFDLILCDWKMINMDGIEFAREVRKANGAKAYTPIIMVTGKAAKEDVELARDAGINEYMVKPFSVKSMCAKIKNIIEAPRPFVMAETYKGPDRRRKSDPSLIPIGIDRRRS